MASKQLKLVVVGEGAVGKSCMILRYAANRVPDEYHVTDIGIQHVSMSVGGSRDVQLALWDTLRLEDADRFRGMSYTNTDGFVLCFSVVDPASLTHALEKWLPELRHFGRDTPILLVGTKSDLRQDERVMETLRRRGQAPVTREQAEEAAHQMRAVGYVECSAMTGLNVALAFEEAAKAAIRKRESSNKCLAM